MHGAVIEGASIGHTVPLTSSELAFHRVLRERYRERKHLTNSTPNNVPIARGSDTLDEFQATFQNANIGLAHVDVNGRWLRANARLIKMLGYSETELLELDVQSITHPEDVDKYVVLLAQFSGGETVLHRHEKRFIRRNSKVIWASVEFAAQHDKAGNLLYIIVSVSNITGNKKLERRLRESAQDIEQLLNLVSHELRNPLNGISINTNLIELAGRNEKFPPPVSRSVGAIQANVKAASDILAYIDKMAVFNPDKADLVVVSLADIINEVLAVSRVDLTETDTQLVVPVELPKVLGQQVAINRVLQNLIDNGIKYRRFDEPCKITLTAEVAEDKVVLKVQDTGRGIPKNQQQHVFKVSWRADNVGLSPGRGLGLAFCRRIMNTLGGSISVVSDETTGTCFALTFKSPASG